MAENKKSVKIYTEWKTQFSYLSDEDAGKLIKHLFAYVNDENPDDPDGVIGMAWVFIKQQLKRDLKKYEALCEKNKENVRKRWDKKDTTVYDRIPNDTKNTDKDKDNKKKYIKKSFLEEAKKVTLVEISLWLKQTEYKDADPAWLLNKLKSFIDNGWVDGKGNKIKSSWKAKLRNQLPYAPKVLAKGKNITPGYMLPI